jgi:TRAP-type C4-dicarboxylate transport system permease small subunit
MNHRRVTRQIISFEKWLINTLLCLSLVSMIILACVQIGLRTFFSGGLLWADPILRHLVLWSGLLGAVVATREKKHIGIDVLGYLAPESVKVWIALLIDLFSSFVSGVITWAAVVFVRNEFLYGDPSLLSVPSWIWNLIFPISFGLICIHFLMAIPLDIKGILSAIQNREPECDS